MISALTSISGSPELDSALFVVFTALALAGTTRLSHRRLLIQLKEQIQTSRTDAESQKPSVPRESIKVEEEGPRMTPDAAPSKSTEDQEATAKEVRNTIEEIHNALMTEDLAGDRTNNLETIDKRLQQLFMETKLMAQNIDAAPVSLYGRLGRVEQLANDELDQTSRMSSQLAAILQKLGKAKDDAKLHAGETIVIEAGHPNNNARPISPKPFEVEAEPVLPLAPRSKGKKPQYQAHNPAEPAVNERSHYAAYRPDQVDQLQNPVANVREESLTAVDMPNFDSPMIGGGVPLLKQHFDELIMGASEVPIRTGQARKLPQAPSFAWFPAPDLFKPNLKSSVQLPRVESSSSGSRKGPKFGTYYMNSSKVLCFEESAPLVDTPGTSDDAVVGVAELIQLKPAPIPMAAKSPVQNPKMNLPAGVVGGDNGAQDAPPPAQIPEDNAQGRKPEDGKPGKNPAGPPPPAPSPKPVAALDFRRPVVYDYPIVLDADQTYRVGQTKPDRFEGEKGDLIRGNDSDNHRIYRIVDAKAFSAIFRVGSHKPMVGGNSFFIDPHALSKMFLSAIPLTSLAYTLDSPWEIYRTSGGSFNDVYFVRNLEHQKLVILRFSTDTLLWQPADYMQFLSVTRLTQIMATRGIHVAQTYAHALTPGIPLAPLHFTIEQTMQGIPAYQWWESSRDTLIARNAIMTAYAVEALKMHRAKMYAYSMGRLDERVTVDCVPADGWPVRPPVIYYHAELDESCHISYGMISGPKVVKEGKIWTNSFEWRMDCFSRWLDTIGRPRLVRVPECKDKVDALKWLALTYLFLMRLAHRRAINLGAEKEKFHIAHVDLGYQNVLARPCYNLPDRKAIFVKTPDQGRTGTQGRPLKAYLSIIDWDDAKFMPMDRGYLAYPPWLYKRHFFQWHSQDVGNFAHPEFNTPQAYEEHRRLYKATLKHLLGPTDAHLVDQWTAYSHWAGSIDDALEKALCSGPDTKNTTWMQAPITFGKIIDQFLVERANVSEETLAQCKDSLVFIGKQLELGQQFDEAACDFIDQFFGLLDQVLNDEPAAEEWTLEVGDYVAEGDDEEDEEEEDEEEPGPIDAGEEMHGLEGADLGGAIRAGEVAVPGFVGKTEVETRDPLPPSSEDEIL